MSRSITVRASTAGTTSPGYEHLSGGYKYRGDPAWYPGHPGYREPPAASAGGGPAASAERQQRIAEFAALRDEGLSPVEAGRALGVQPKTARTYERESRALRKAAP